MSDAEQAEQIQLLKAENARLRRLLDQHGMPSVLRHQVRNALGLIRAILRRSAEGGHSVEDLVAHVEGRFDALLRVQNALLASPDGQIDLSLLVGEELLAQTIAEGERATVTGPSVRLDGRSAEFLGLALHELAINAIKFGALTTTNGRIDVSWVITPGPPRLALLWLESGQSRSPRPATRGFGMEAIERMLPYQLRAESRLEILTEGLRCEITLPLPA